MSAAPLSLVAVPDDAVETVDVAALERRAEMLDDAIDEMRAERDRLRDALRDMREMVSAVVTGLPDARLVSRNTAVGHFLLLAGRIDDALGD